MRREKREENANNEEKMARRRNISVVGFLIAITLLSIAIIISMTPSQSSETAELNKLKGSNNSDLIISEASKSLSKNINEVENSISSGTLNILNNNNASSEKNNTNDVHDLENIQEESNNSEDSTNKSEKAEENKINSTNEKDNTDNDNFIMPIEGKITKPFSMDGLIYSETLQEWTTHRGIDIEAEKTTVVKAVKSGTVKSIKQDPRYGLSITIEHKDGFTSVYSSLLSTEFVEEGEEVKQGDSIGTVGNSAVFESSDGSHLHFELMKNGEYVNPEIYIK